MKIAFKIVPLFFLLLFLTSCNQPVIVSFQANGGILPEGYEREQIIDDDLGDLPIPEKEGYLFLGWFLSNDEESEEFNPTLPLTESISLYAHWEKKILTVTFQYEDGEIISTRNVEYGTNIIFPEEPIKTGFIFLGWDYDNQDVTQNLTITALFSRIEFTVTFKDDEGTILKRETVAYGESATAPTVEEKEGFEFQGWDHDFTNVLSDLIITTIYKTPPLRDESGTIFPSNLKYGSTDLLEKVQKGDIIFEAASLNGIGHTAIVEGIYYSDDYDTYYIRVIEAIGEGVVRNIYDENRLNYGLGSIWRVNQATESEIDAAVDFSISQLGKAYSYDGIWSYKGYLATEEDWYCSELVWASYYNQGIDVEKEGGGRIGGVLPRDIIEDDDVFNVTILSN